MSQNLNLIDRFLIYHILNSTAECRMYQTCLLQIFLLADLGIKVPFLSLPVLKCTRCMHRCAIPDCHVFLTLQSLRDCREFVCDLPRSDRHRTETGINGYRTTSPLHRGTVYGNGILRAEDRHIHSHRSARCSFLRL